MNSIQAQAALACVAMPTLLAVYRAHTRDPSSTASRAQVIQALAAQVAAGNLSVDSIRAHGAAAVGRAPAQAPARPAPESGQTGSFDPRVTTMVHQIGAAESHIHALGQRLDAQYARLDGVAQDVGQVARSLGTLTAQVGNNDRATETLAQDLGTLRKDLGRVVRADAGAIEAQVRAAVTDALLPVLAAVETRPELAPQVAQAAVTPAQADCDQVFGLDVRDPRGDPLRFKVFAHPEAPAIDGHHIWTERMVRFLALAQATGRNCWLGGPAGTGKTQTVAQFAARTGRIFRRFVFDRLATREDYLGAVGLQQGSTVFQQGPVLDAYTTTGGICLLDEVGMGNASALSSLNGWLEPNARMAYGDKVWHRAPGSMFFACDNSLTQGDQTGRYAGVGQMNVAFADRFSFVIPMTYLDPDQEADAIARHTGCSVILARHVVDALAVCRSKVDKGEVIDPPSIRQAISFVEACRFLPVAEAWAISILARQPAESSVALAAVFASNIDCTLIIREL